MGIKICEVNGCVKGYKKPYPFLPVIPIEEALLPKILLRKSETFSNICEDMWVWKLERRGCKEM